MTKIIDFRSGRNGWSRATWLDRPPRVTGHFWWKRSHRTASVMVQTPQTPCDGDVVLWTSSAGEHRATIVEVVAGWKLADMFRLHLEGIGPARQSDLQAVWHQGWMAAALEPAAGGLPAHR